MQAERRRAFALLPVGLDVLTTSFRSRRPAGQRLPLQVSDKVRARVLLRKSCIHCQPFGALDNEKLWPDRIALSSWTFVLW